MTNIATTAPARLATRLAFFASGFVTACLAPLIPFAKSHVSADEGQLGLILLCLGGGSLVAMPVTGIAAARKGARLMILLGGFGMALMLPLLALAASPLSLAGVLFLFGASLGTIDVAMNIHGAEVEARERRPLMSNFHAMFSIGGLCGAGAMTLLLTFHVPVLAAACVGAIASICAMLPTRSRLLRAQASDPVPFAWPRGIVLLLAVLAAIMFLLEGAVLDWGALLIVDRGLTSVESAGAGYMIFAAAMVVGRLSGGWLIARISELRLLVLGSGAVIAGVAIILLAPWPPLALSGFALIGLGAANLVPIVFSAAGRQTVMPPGLALAAVTTIAYAGVLAGPALVGFVADATSLPTAFWALAILTLAIPLSAARVVRA